MYCKRSDVGICGMKLLYDDNSIQHAGVTLGIKGLAGHRYKEIKEEEYNKYDYINFVQDLSAVTAACIMTPKSIYEEVGWMDEGLAVAFNDVDFCLKMW